VSRKREPQFEAPGADSFLDVVANLVGIMIILVMVVGSQAKSAILLSEAQKQQAAASINAPALDVAGAEAAAADVERSVYELQSKVERQNLEAAMRKEERDRMQLLVTIAEQRIAEHRDRLSQADRAKFDVQNQLASARDELSRLQLAPVPQAASPEVLPHLPTPMAKTVFGKELQFRLLNKQLAYVPWDEMLERLKADAPQTAQKLRDSPRVEQSLPVIDGWGAKYILRRTDVEVQTRAGAARGQQVELERFVFIQVDPDLGEPLARALQPTSQFRSRLSACDPQRTTVTVWVYPDSFDEFRQLKAELFKLGFLAAGRPLPDGFPIGGSPDGSRSNAQ